MSEQFSLKDAMELIKLKREKPEEYKQFFEDWKELMIDTFKIAQEMAKEMENE